MGWLQSCPLTGQCPSSTFHQGGVEGRQHPPLWQACEVPRDIWLHYHPCTCKGNQSCQGTWRQCRAKTKTGFCFSALVLPSQTASYHMLHIPQILQPPCSFTSGLETCQGPWVLVHCLFTYLALDLGNLWEPLGERRHSPGLSGSSGFQLPLGAHQWKRVTQQLAWVSSCQWGPAVICAWRREGAWYREVLKAAVISQPPGARVGKRGPFQYLPLGPLA